MERRRIGVGEEEDRSCEEEDMSGQEEPRSCEE